MLFSLLEESKALAVVGLFKTFNVVLLLGLVTETQLEQGEPKFCNSPFCHLDKHQTNEIDRDTRLKKLVNWRLLNNDDGSNDDDDDTDADVVTKLRRMTTTTTTKLPVVVRHPWNNIKRISDTTGIKIASFFSHPIISKRAIVKQLQNVGRNHLKVLVP